MAKNSLRDYFVGVEREQQADVLEKLYSKWDEWDVAVLSLPVAVGKSKIAEAIVRGAAAKRMGLSSNGGVIVANNNLLVNQYLNTTKGFSPLHKRDSYSCHTHKGLSCVERAEKIGGHCRSPSGNNHHPGACPLVRDLRTSRVTEKLIVNQHIYMAHKLYRDVVIFDEAHTLLQLLQEMGTRKYWRHDFNWPRTLNTADDVREWLDSVRGGKEWTERHQLLSDILDGSRGGYSLILGEEEFRGIDRELIRLTPLDVRDAPPILWPGGKVKKIILMSATINDLDVAALGLDQRRVLKLETGSPIPVGRRPFVNWPTALDFRFNNREEGMAEMAWRIEEDLFPEHSGERGLIHAPYAVAAQLAEHLSSKRVITHTRENKKEVVSSWMAGKYGPDAVLLGSGLSEGLDLAGDLCRFQVITTTPRKSIGDPGLAWLAENRPAEYEWFTIRDLAQTYGRVCRSPDDYGTTICLDSSVSRELASSQVPGWLKEAIVNVED